MLLGRVEGHAVATIHHPSMDGHRLLVVQPLRSLTLEPVLAIDTLGAGRHDVVLLTSDGKGARELTGHKNTPVRWTVLGIIDDAEKTLRSAGEEFA